MDIPQLFERATNYTAATNYRNHCDLDTCPLSSSYYAYRPSLGANATFLALFAFSLLCFTIQGLLSRRFIGFTIAMVCGCALEVIGYVGRVLSYENPFDEVQGRYSLLLLTFIDLCSLEWLPNPDCLPDHRSRFHGCSSLPHPIAHCHDIRPGQLAHSSSVVSTDLHSL